MERYRTNLDCLEHSNNFCEPKITVTGISTGFKAIDCIIGGLMPSELVLVVDNSSVGKTAFALNMASFIGQHNRGGVAYFTLGMSKKQLIQCMLCSEGCIDVEKYRKGELEDDEWTSLYEASERLSEATIYIDDTKDITMIELCSRVRSLNAEHGLSAIFIDYLQLLQDSFLKNCDNCQREISNIIHTLKELARDVNVPIILLSLLSHSLKNSQCKSPILSDICELCSLGHDADTVMYLYCDDFSDRGTVVKNIMEVIIVIHRNGLVDKVKLNF